LGTAKIGPCCYHHHHHQQQRRGKWKENQMGSMERGRRWMFHLLQLLLPTPPLGK